MSHRWHQAPTSLAALTCVSVSLFGCNAILGIDAPSDQLLDSGGFTHHEDAGDDNDASALVDAGVPPITGSHARANWPMPNPVITGLSNPQTYSVSTGLVIDNVTGLEWQRVASNSSMSWADAEQVCTGLALSGGGFRLPSRIELLSLVDFTQDGSAIDAQAFPDTPAEGFWSATIRPGSPRAAWGVNFGFSTGVVFQDDVNHERRVRCVRSDDEGASVGRFTVTDGVVEDTATQLQWQQVGLDTQSAWDAAKAHCNALDLQGSAWRLPTIKELHTLIDETRDNPAADVATFPAVAANYYWTSSQPKSFSNLAWAVGFDRGLDVFRSTTSTAYVRCVR